MWGTRTNANVVLTDLRNPSLLHFVFHNTLSSDITPILFSQFFFQNLLSFLVMILESFSYDNTSTICKLWAYLCLFLVLRDVFSPFWYGVLLVLHIVYDCDSRNIKIHTIIWPDLWCIEGSMFNGLKPHKSNTIDYIDI